LRENRALLYHFLDVPLTDKGKIFPNEHAVRCVLQKHERYKGKLWVEDTKDELMEAVQVGTPRPYADSFVGSETAWMQEHIGQGLRPSHVSVAVHSIPGNPANHRNAIHEYVNRLRWDMTPRVEEMFIRGWGAANTTYTRAIGRAWLLSAMARAFRPGCEMQTMLVLEGPQGIGKSRSLKAIGGEWYVETATKMDSKDFILEAHRSWFFDLAELGAYKFADFSFAKAILSTATDVLRAPYARTAETKPRRFVVVATTNEREYLRDLTGNRRFWPMECSKIDLDWITDNRDQLMAEAKVQLDAGEAWWVPDVLTAPVQNARLVADPWEDQIAALLVQVKQTPAIDIHGTRYFLVASATLLQGLGVTAATAHAGHYSRIAALMRAHFPDWEKYRYSNPQKPVAVCGTLQGTVHGYRLPMVGALPTSNVIPINP
jgi:putative DNA primase/helicase